MNNYYWNAHWSRIHWTCSPCQYEYSYIVNIETFNEDVDYIMKKFNVTEVNSSTHKHST